MSMEKKFKTIIKHISGEIETVFIHPFQSELDSENADKIMPSGSRHLAIGLQYILLKDKNGKEIYEGDIIVADWGFDNPTIVSMDINSEYNFMYWLVEYALSGDNLLIIGNIYENPDLIKK